MITHAKILSFGQRSIQSHSNARYLTICIRQRANVKNKFDNKQINLVVLPVDQKKSRETKRLERGYNHDKFLERLRIVASFLRGKGEKEDIVWTRFALKIGFEYDLLMSWINKGNTPLVDGLVNFCNKTAISLEWLLNGKGPMLSRYSTGRLSASAEIYTKKIHSIEASPHKDITYEDIDFLITVLEQHGDEYVRKSAAHALKKRPSVRAVVTLQFAAEHDKDMGVREQAQEALIILDKDKYEPWVWDMLQKKDEGIPPPPRIVYMDTDVPEMVEDFRKRHDRDAFIPIRVLDSIQDLYKFRGPSKASTLRYALIYQEYLPPSARHQNLENEQFVCVIAEDSSMAPTIPKGAVVAIDLFDREEIDDHKIYVVYNKREKEEKVAYPMEDVATLKRVRKSGANLNFYADNPEERRYPRSVRLEPGHEHVHILGKVLWWESRQEGKK